MAERDFPAIAAAALASAEILLPEWGLAGSRQGDEWVGLRRANGGMGDSWKVNLTTGVWAHFGATGPDSKGRDMIAICAALHHTKQSAAADMISSRLGLNGHAGINVLPARAPSPKPKPIEPLAESCDPIPADAPPIPNHREYGRASAQFAYGAAFIIARYDLPGRKEFCPYTWRKGRWSSRGHPAPRPLYRLTELLASPHLPVLMVEGEKCADALQPLLASHIVMTWAGGAGGVAHNDLTPLCDRAVTLWPDADPAGAQAMATLKQLLHRIAASVHVVRTEQKPHKWDAYDAIHTDGWDTDQIQDFIREPAKQELVAPADPDSDYEAGANPRSVLALWDEIGLHKDGKHVPHANLANASMILQRHSHYTGKVWFDSFRGKIYHSLNGAPALWTDADTRRATAYIQQQLDLPRVNIRTVDEAIQHAAECNARNSLTDWLDSLKWKGTERLDTWLFDCLGCERNEYNDAVARNWLLSMVARAYQPGCQVDTMPVIEGSMGRGKSRFLEVLASPWFASIQIAFGEKDFFQAIQGRWLIEIPDMSGFSRREHTQILATITTRVDVYRKSHGRITEEHPRVTVFAATSETDDYLQDTRGRRRYWPLRCGEISLDTLHEQREQLFAEAVHKYRAGATWHEMPDGVDEEQLARASDDLWEQEILGHAEAAWELQSRTGIAANITSSGLLRSIGVLIPDQTDAEKKRIARIMTAHGWWHPRTKNQRFWAKLPDRVKVKQ